jgi:hypothetical protein
VQADLIRDSNKLDADLETTYSLALAYERYLQGARPGTVSEYNVRTNQAITSSDIVHPRDVQTTNLNALTMTDVCGFCKEAGHVFGNCPKVLKKKAEGT